MSIIPINIYNPPKNGLNENKKQAFGSPVSFMGNVMQSVENGGFMASFLIQDTLGMTLPRTYQGLNRNEDVLGHKNYKEAAEVALREGLSGPAMVLTPIATFWAMKKGFGKLSGVNTNIIKSINNAVSKSLDTAINNGNKSSAIKDNIYDSIAKKLSKNNNPKEIVNHLKAMDDVELKLAQMKGKDKKVLKAELADKKSKIIEYFNRDVRTKGNIENINRIELDGATYKTSDVIDGIRAYASDAEKAVKNNKPQDFVNASVAKRFGANLASLAATIGVMKLIPAVYSINKTAPGLDGLAKNSEEVKSSDKNAELKNVPNESVKDTKKQAMKGGVASKVGEKISKLPKGYFKNFEFDGYNFSTPLIATTILGGLLAPRVYQAEKRAITLPDGTKDQSEVKEILARDVTSSFTVVFGVPLASRAAIAAAEKKTGFVLTQKPAGETSLVKKTLELINPFSKRKVYSTDDLSKIYFAENKTDVKNLCKFIDKDYNGDLKKIFSKSEEAAKLLKLADIKETGKAANKTIIEKVGKLSDDAAKALFKDGKIAKHAKDLTAIPGFVATFAFVPLVLGLVLPKLTYGLTRKAFDEQQKNNA